MKLPEARDSLPQLGLRLSEGLGVATTKGKCMSTEKLIEALREVLECEREEAEARQRYSDGGGMDWGYHGFHFRQLSETAGAEFQAALNGAIDARVRAVLAEVEVHKGRSAEAPNVAIKRLP